ncbi:hypothetical protein VKT23_011162 [Stygiomarasmius scandens]|uniref:Uncharacterized protein n=1 Tax=Marasmiellus scandens TaxID=2682957 RepID=A0ABR1JAP2_9AGAR
MPSGQTLIQSHLPAIPGSTYSPANYKTVTPSADSTRNTPCPKVVMNFGNEMRDALNHASLQPSLQRQYNSIDTETSSQLKTEGDVERTAALYLTHNPIIIIEDLLSRNPRLGGLRVLSQHTSGGDRPDLVFYVGNTIVLVLEYKKTDTLDKSNWDPAFALNLQIAAQLAQARGNNLQKNAIVIAQQCAKYGRSTQLTCPLVLCANYQKMVLLDFKYNNQVYDNATNPVRWWFSNDETSSFLTHQQLLLAALVYGMQKQGLL